MEPQNNNTNYVAKNPSLDQEKPIQNIIIDVQNNVMKDENEKKNIQIQIQDCQPAAYGQWKKISNDIMNLSQNPSQSNANNSKNTQNLIENLQYFNRVNHCTFYYKNCVYMFGGHQPGYVKRSNESMQMQNVEQQNVIQQNPPSLNLELKNCNITSQNRKQLYWNSFFKYNVITKQISRLNINVGSNANLLMNISSFGYFISGSFLYIFGGLNYQTQVLRNPQMCSINLDSGTMKRLQSKTSLLSIPSSRINPVITAIQKSILFLFGGQVYNPNTETSTYLNDMYIFKIETKTWTKIQETFHLRFPILFRPYLINFGDNCIYLFGGKRQILDSDGIGVKYIESHDIYKLKIVTKMVNYRADCCVKQVHSTNPIPKSQSIVKVIKYNDKGLFAITTESSKPGSTTYFWYYDQQNAIWAEIKQHFFNTKKYLTSISSQNRQDFALTSQKIFCIQKLQANQFMPEFYQFSFHQITLQSIIKQTLSYYKKVLCSICQQEKKQNKMTEQKFQIPAQKYEQLSSSLQFPFAAVGLLVDNTMLTKAKNCNIYFNVGTLGKDTSDRQKDKGQKQFYKTKYMIIQDNGYPGYIWNPQLRPIDFHTIVNNFSAITAPQQIMATQDNKNLITKCHKQIQQKQKNLQKQFTYFQKLQNKNNTNSSGGAQNSYNNVGSNSHLRNQKDFEKQHQQYIEKRHRLQHKQKMLQIQQKCRRYYNNLKLAGVRLGQTIIYACRQKKDEQNLQTIDKQKDKDKDIRRYFFMRKQKCVITSKQYYVSYGYVTQNGNPADPRMESSIKYLSKQFKKQLKIINEKFKTMNNIVIICDLKNMTTNQQLNSLINTNLQKNYEKSVSSTYELRLKKRQNDIFYGQSNILNYLQTNSMAKISQICDISLKAYLSMLYLSREDRDDPNINLSIRQNQLQFINVQPYLQTMDRLLQSRKTVQISKSLNFDDECPVVQVYWYSEYATNNDTIANKVNSLGFMLNGILIYYRGRLVSRFDIQLGKLLDNLEFNQKYGSMFGFLDVKQEYGTNIFSTDMFFPKTFEKFYSRLNFVFEFMENRYKHRKVRPRGDDHSSGYQKISKRSKND